jgi:hypothetical protein
VVAAVPELRDLVTRAVEELARTVNEATHQNVEVLVESLLPSIEIPSLAASEEARRQAHLRERIMSDFGAWSAAEVASLAGSTAANRFQLAHKWNKEGRIFRVPYHGVWLYLGFQFDENGRPLPVVADVLRALAPSRPWELAEWFVLGNGCLGRERPVDLLVKDPVAVVSAARFDATRGSA